MSASTVSPLAGLRVLLVTAFDPAAIGNGSSMRAGRWCAALRAASGTFDAVVVPVVGSEPASPFRRVVLPDEQAIVRGAATLMGVRWRDWMVRTAPLPPSAARAPAWMGRQLLADLSAGGVAGDGWQPDLVIAFKMAVAPFAADLAMDCGVPLVVDLDDDEAALAAAQQNPHADALERLLRGVGELATVLTVASPTDVPTVQARVAAPVMLVPNAVPLPDLLPVGLAGRLLYVANFEYGPNRASANWLLQSVLPLIRGVSELSVVGAFGDRLGAQPPAVAYGRLPDLDACYRDASVVVCPVLAGSGTSIKVIEAMAHGRAVVTTSVGARGLGLTHGVHALIADDPAGFAAAVTRVLASPAEAAALGAGGRALVAERYSAEVGAAAMAGAAAAAAAAALGR